ncbi:MAG TPA: Asp23/Gls24 family envelope stress response protein [Pseudonocardia sp.]|jgi:uncharacterized alkaline shock family protein YloU|nr:Asp23/Gls24 family envelope stress response protein [Pseudonocardia sp.]
MSSATADAVTAENAAKAARGAAAPAASVDATGPLASSLGQTRISELVVTKIAGLATREVRGVYGLGGPAARAFDALRERIPGGTSSVGQGVSVEVGDRQAAVDLSIVVEYGVPIVEVAANIRRNVIGAITRMTGLEVVEVNIAVGDVHLPAAADEPAAAIPTTRVS